MNPRNIVHCFDDLASLIGQLTNTIAKKTCRLCGDKVIDEFSYIVQSLEAAVTEGMLHLPEQVVIGWGQVW